MEKPYRQFGSLCLLNASLLFFVVVVVVFIRDAACRVDANDGTRHSYQQHEDEELQSYIIHVERPPPSHIGTHRDWHESFLQRTGAAARLIHSYTHVLSGFAAKLTDADVQTLRGMSSFVHAQLTRQIELHTTHTPSFLGLQQDPSGAWAKEFNYGRGVIIGVVDTGITPSHPSFHDDGSIPAPPPKWKGKCELNDASLCNNKLIGARSFVKTPRPSTSPLDEDGHGTHTAGTAAGAFVTGAGILNNANGTAAGTAPRAHIAAYRVCNRTCNNADVIAGIDAAVADGVDIISMSLGGSEVPFYRNPIAAATFAAARMGVLVSASAGNSGPGFSTLGNTYPWVLTVGASTTDRRIRAVVRLQNGTDFQGESAYQATDFNSSVFLPLVLPFIGNQGDLSCSNETALELADVKGKIVLCFSRGSLTAVEKGKLVKKAGGAAMILMSPASRGYDTRSDPHELPAAHVSNADGVSILQYIATAQSPTATIVFEGTKIGSSFGDPAVTSFSSRGPSRVAIGVLKPDVIGPGLNILAAWSKPVGPFPQQPSFNMESGTSMSCPHLSGVAALLKSKYPDWSPAMIKSAILTTADESNLNGNPFRDNFRNTTASVFATGAGHINPIRAANPGLVYDSLPDEYVAYLCRIGYTDAQVRIITNEAAPANCSAYSKITEDNLNYPSFTVKLSLSPSTNGSDVEVTAKRTVTNVGSLVSSYTLRLLRPIGITMSVQPETLEFRADVTKASFTVRFGLNNTEAELLRATVNSTSTQGSLTWVASDKKTTVTSAIAVLLGDAIPFTASLQNQSVILH